MAATQAQIGYGVHLARGDGASPEVFTNIAELVDFDPPSMEKEQVEATHTDSPGGFREYIPGLKDGGEMTFVCNYLPNDPTQSEAAGGALNDFLNDNTYRNWKITWPGSPAKTWTFAATLTSYKPAAPLGDRMQLTVTAKVSGQPTIA